MVTPGEVGVSVYVYIFFFYLEISNVVESVKTLCDHLFLSSVTVDDEYLGQKFVPFFFSLFFLPYS